MSMRSFQLVSSSFTNTFTFSWGLFFVNFLGTSHLTLWTSLDISMETCLRPTTTIAHSTSDLNIMMYKVLSMLRFVFMNFSSFQFLKVATGSMQLGLGFISLYISTTGKLCPPLLTISFVKFIQVLFYVN